MAPQVTSVPAGFERTQAFVPSGGADVFENEIDALLACNIANFFRDFLLVVIDDVIGTELAGFRHFVIIAGRRNDLAIEEFRDLDSSDSDAEELAPRTSTVWPGRIPARPTNMCQAVRNTSGALAA